MVNGPQRPPGQGLSKKAKRRRNKRKGGKGSVPSMKRKALPLKRRANLVNLIGMASRAGANKARRKRAKSGVSFSKVTDGVNQGMAVRNQSTVEDHFELRTEKVGNFSGTSGFTITPSTGYYINPGNSQLFPVFSQIASTYEQYRVDYLEFFFATEAYTAVSSTASAGKVIMATNFDVDDGVFANDTSMENYEGMTKDAPFQSFSHDVVLAHKKRHAKTGRGGRSADLPLNNYYVYSSGNSSGPSNSTDKFYDVGLFQFATASNAVTTEIGELYVSYKFTMIRPKQQIPTGNNLLQAHIVENPVTTAAASTPFGTTAGSGSLRAGSTLPIVVTGNTFTLPVAGSFVLTAIFGVASSAGAAAVATFSYGSNISEETIIGDSSVGHYATVVSGKALFDAVVLVSSSGTGANNTVTLGGLTSLAGASTDIFVTQISTGLLAPRVSDKLCDDCVVRNLTERLEKAERLISRLCGETDEKSPVVFVDDVLGPQGSLNPVSRSVLSHFGLGG